MKARYNSNCARPDCKSRIVRGSHMIYDRNNRSSYHVGCEPGGARDQDHPLIQLARTAWGTLPTARSKGSRVVGYTGASKADWDVIVQRYREAGVRVEWVDASKDHRYGRGYQFFMVLEGHIRVNTGLDTGWSPQREAFSAHRRARYARFNRGRRPTRRPGAGEQRKKGSKAIHIVVVNDAGRPIGGEKKVLRTDGWQGRVFDRVNELLLSLASPA